MIKIYTNTNSHNIFRFQLLNMNELFISNKFRSWLSYWYKKIPHLSSNDGDIWMPLCAFYFVCIQKYELWSVIWWFGSSTKWVQRRFRWFYCISLSGWWNILNICPEISVVLRYIYFMSTVTIILFSFFCFFLIIICPAVIQRNI